MAVGVGVYVDVEVGVGVGVYVDVGVGVDVGSGVAVGGNVAVGVGEGWEGSDSGCTSNPSVTAVASAPTASPRTSQVTRLRLANYPSRPSRRRV